MLLCMIKFVNSCVTQLQHFYVILVFVTGSSEEENMSSGLNRIQITSGTRTYRIPSPTRSHAPISRNSFSSPTPPSIKATPEKGFYISFDEDTPPKRPKPPLRVKRNSPKKVNLGQLFEFKNKLLVNLN